MRLEARWPPGHGAPLRGNGAAAHAGDRPPGCTHPACGRLAICAARVGASAYIAVPPAQETRHTFLGPVAGWCYLIWPLWWMMVCWSACRGPRPDSQMPSALAFRRRIKCCAAGNCVLGEGSAAGADHDALIAARPGVAAPIVPAGDLAGGLTRSSDGLLRRPLAPSTALAGRLPRATAVASTPIYVRRTSQPAVRTRRRWCCRCRWDRC